MEKDYFCIVIVFFIIFSFFDDPQSLSLLLFKF